MMTNQTATKTVLDIFDPAMCCSTGVCGPDVDESLADFANDVKWLKKQGIEVNRFNLGQEPEVFKSNPVVLSKLQKEGTAVLPIIMINGEIISEGGYPDRDQLSGWLSLDSPSTENGSPVQNTVSLLHNLEMAITNGDEIELRVHFQNAERAGISKQELVQSMQAGINNRQRVTQSMLETSNSLLGVQTNSCAPGSGCC
jgi:alkylhydroperoxidase/carboxymuconolactone decarboxylase family protein YurZ